VEPLGRTGEHLRPRWLSETALLSGAATHGCCIAVVLITLGVGATLAGLVSAFPPLVLRRDQVFGVAGRLLPAPGGAHARCAARPTRAWRPYARARSGSAWGSSSGPGKSCLGNPRLCPRAQSAVMEFSRACRANLTGCERDQSPIPRRRPTKKAESLGVSPGYIREFLPNVAGNISAHAPRRLS